MEKRLAGTGPIRRFLAALFGRAAAPDFSLGERGPDDEPGAAGAGDRSPLLPRVPTLAGAAARRLEDEPSDR